MTKIKKGDLVLISKTAHNKTYGSRLALVLAIEGQSIKVTTGTFELAYETKHIEYHASIALERQYATPSGNRFRNYRVQPSGEGTPFLGSAKIREGKQGASITDVLSQKSLAYEGYKAWLTNAAKKEVESDAV